MLSHLLKILQALVLSLHNGAHSAERCLLQLLAAVKRVAVLEKTDIVLGDIVDEMLGSIDLAQGKFVVVLVIEDVHEVGVERMDVVELGELADDGGQLVVIGLLGELHLAGVEAANTGDLVMAVDDGRRLSLSL